MCKKILRDSIWLPWPFQSRCSIWNWGPIWPNPPIFRTVSPRFPEPMDQRQRRRFQDVSKLGRPALQFSNQSGQHHRSVVHLSSAIAVRAVPKSAGYREIWWNNMKQLCGTLDGLGHLRSNWSNWSQVWGNSPRKQSCNRHASQRFTFWIQLSAQACRQSR